MLFSFFFHVFMLNTKFEFLNWKWNGNITTQFTTSVTMSINNLNWILVLNGMLFILFTLNFLFIYYLFFTWNWRNYCKSFLKYTYFVLGLSGLSSIKTRIIGVIQIVFSYVKSHHFVVRHFERFLENNWADKRWRKT